MSNNETFIDEVSEEVRRDQLFAQPGATRFWPHIEMFHLCGVNVMAKKRAQAKRPNETVMR